MEQEKYQGIDRDTYKRVKSLNREKMNEFLGEVYDLGRNSVGVAEMDFAELRGKIATVKGIGEKRLDQIMAIIEEYLLGEQQEEKQAE
ncbi:MAG: hypothetical protein SO119_07390 [Phascolarctobacterium sp.]|nr:hypothetical protein [Phascolarctobacterium sp.]